MEQTQEQTFEAWVDEKRRLGSFHKIPGARRYCAPEACVLGAGNRAGAFGLPGAIGRVKNRRARLDAKKRMLRLSRQDGCR